MGLRERLEAAEAERRRAAGLPVWNRADNEPGAAKPNAAPAARPSRPGSSAVPVVDLRKPAPVIDLRTRAPARDQLSPTSAPRATRAADPAADTVSCPSCGDPGRLDMQDIVGHLDHYSCLGCGSLFQLQR